LKEIGKQQFPEIDEKFAPAAAASTMFDPVRIKWLQTALNVLGATPPLDVDGEYGPMTKDAVLQFQKAHDLVADGWAGDATPPRCSFRLPRSQNRRKTLRSPDKGHAHQKLYALGTGGRVSLESQHNPGLFLVQSFNAVPIVRRGLMEVTCTTL
jgi:peptidoglycan hydrolase-like protein with peptidoglycan-binding domain